LTFDDGPHPGWTPKLLAVLHDCAVPATFFVVGHQVEKYPELARAIDSMGFTIGNHTYDHVSLLKIPAAYVPTEILACADAVRTATGVTPRFFRPPGGEFDKAVAVTAEEMGYQTVLWTDDPGDFARPSAETILRRTLARATPGGIILLHDGIPETLEMLPELVSELRLQGYDFVSMDELIRERDADAKAAPKVPGAVPADYIPIIKENRQTPKQAPTNKVRPDSMPLLKTVSGSAEARKPL
jgi:peptidoglycan/xylan/chitin deacetylase (PgdA/CDA1 family)